MLATVYGSNVTGMAFHRQQIFDLHLSVQCLSVYNATTGPHLHAFVVVTGNRRGYF